MMRNFASTKNTPGSITTSKLGQKSGIAQKAKNLQQMNNQQMNKSNDGKSLNTAIG